MSANHEPTPPILAAHHLLGRVCIAARRAGDTGREFVSAGIQRLVGAEIETRRAAAGEIGAIGDDVMAADCLVADCLADDGLIDAAEAARIRTALRQPGRAARRLGARLQLPEESS